MIKILKKYLLSILVILTIFILCLMNTEPLPPSPMTNFDKLVHTVMFLGLSGVIFFDNTGYLRFPISKIRIFLSVFLLPVAIGGLIEIMQEYLTITRSGDWFDFLFDTLGALFGMMIAFIINRWLPFRKKSF